MYCIELISHDHFRITQVDQPEPSKGEVLVKVASAALNPVDYKLAGGAIPIDKPAVLGHELSGTVISDGEKFKKGDQVMAYLPGPHTQSSGALAEFVAIPEVYVCQKPSNLNLTQACAYPLTALTAYRCVARINPEANKTAFVVGANGAVGILIVQLLTHLKVNVTALVRTDKAKQTLLKQTKLAAENIILDKALISDRTFDYCYDLVGGALKELCFSHAAFSGHVVTIVEERGIAIDLWDARKSPAFAKSLTVHFEFLGAEAYFGGEKEQKIYSHQLTEVRKLIEEKVFHYGNLEVTKTLNVENLEHLLRQLKDRSSNANKLVLTF